MKHRSLGHSEAWQSCAKLGLWHAAESWECFWGAWSWSARAWSWVEAQGRGAGLRRWDGGDGEIKKA